MTTAQIFVIVISVPAFIAWGYGAWLGYLVCEIVMRYERTLMIAVMS